MKTVAVLINNTEQQFEGLRTSLGLLLYNTWVQMFVVNEEIANLDEAYHDNLEFLEEMEGERFSNNKANVEKYGFKYASIEEIGEMLRKADLVITRPDVTVGKFMQSVTNGDRAEVNELYEFQNDSDWSKLVDEIFESDKVISWW
jgi:hypothetical protein